MDSDKILAGLKLHENVVKAPSFLEVSSTGSRNAAAVGLCFDQQKVLGTFGISNSLEYVDNSDGSLKQAQLIPKTRFRSLIGKNLGTDFNIAEKQEDYKAYSELKARFFMRWLLDSKYFKKVEQKKVQEAGFLMLRWTNHGSHENTWCNSFRRLGDLRGSIQRCCVSV